MISPRDRLRVAQHGERPKEQKVAKHIRLALGRLVMQCRKATSLVSTVNEIVMEQRGTMKQFNGLGRIHGGGRVSPTSRRRDEHEQPPNHLSASKIIRQ